MKLKLYQTKLLIIFALLGVYLIGYYSAVFEGKILSWWSDLFWTLASLVAALRSWLTAKSCPNRHEGTAWLFFSLAAFSWFIGMLIWDYYEIFGGKLIPFPSVGDWFFMGYALFFIVGIFYYHSQSRSLHNFMIRAANLGIIISTVIIFCFFLLSSVLEQSENPFSYKIYALSHSILTIAAFLFGLYCYWFYIWKKNKQSFQLLLISLFIFAITDTLYAFQLLGQTFNASSYLNVYWLLAFALHYLGAVVQDQVNYDESKKHIYDEPLTGMIHFAKYEAIMPAICLISIFIFYYFFKENLNHLSNTFILVISATFIFFLGMREWYSNQLETALIKEVRDSELHIKTIINTLPDLVWLKDIQGIYLNCNSKFEHLFGKKESEIIGKSDYDFVNKELADFFRENDKITMAMAMGNSNTNEEEVVYADDGHKEILETIKTPFFSSNGGLLGTLGIGRDITSRKQSEETLKEQHEYLQSIIDGVYDPIMVIKEDYSIDLMSSRLFETIKDSLTNNSDHPKCYEVSHHRTTPCDGIDHPCPLNQTLKSKNHTVMVHEHFGLDGKKCYVEISASPLFDKDKNCIGIIESSRDITTHLKVQDELREQKKSLAFQAHHDALTGLPNRVLFNDRLKQGIEKSKRNRTKMALLFIDLDHFKEINDSLGHDIGDKVLKIATQRLNDVIRNEDTLARLGGDEFTILMEELIQGQDASILAGKIVKIIAQPIIIEDHCLYISSSIGISLYPDDGCSAHDLLKYADTAMYKAKDEGRNNFQYYRSEMTELAFERVVMEANLRAALKEEEFVVYYQPQMNGNTNKLTGMEALVRWQHPIMGLVSPAKFIPLAESTGIIIELDQFVMKTAMMRLVDWCSQGLNPGRLALNLAIKQLQQKDFINILKNLINETQCKPEWLEFEVTEGQIMTNPEAAIKVLKQISELGIELSVDDFGTGYSSLSYLKKLPINKLKIDQSFVRNLPEDEEDAAIAKSVIALSQSLNLKIIAEGVETNEQKHFLINNGCENIQGYFYSKPMPDQEMEKYIKKNNLV
ncbi:MAG: EAL domain-containing protein [gamma proteobacterium symbiont of Taylorina sp.]|nr:EAL domain-containing protein [gamma proteobacterium symbiont of Taylorina sp.]